VVVNSAVISVAMRLLGCC